MTDQVLIVDDDQAVSGLLYKIVRSNGMDADVALNGEDALQMLKNKKYDLFLIDINMPGMDGFELLQSIRTSACQSPVIIVSGRQEEHDTLYALNIGADDYVTKPFNPVILGAKMKALIRRSRTSLHNNAHVLTAGPFKYDTNSMRFFKNDTEIFLSSKETIIMKLFMDNVNRLFSKDMIYDLAWGDSIIDENTIMVYMNRLRQKIEDDPANPQYLKTVRGLGYRFVVS